VKAEARPLRSTAFWEMIGTLPDDAHW
jgi:hypothetical protein